MIIHSFTHSLIHRFIQSIHAWGISMSCMHSECDQIFKSFPTSIELACMLLLLIISIIMLPAKGTMHVHHVVGAMSRQPAASSGWCSRKNQLMFVTSGKTTHHFRGIYGTHASFIKKKQKELATCNMLDLETRGYQLIVAQKLRTGWCLRLQGN